MLLSCEEVYHNEAYLRQVKTGDFILSKHKNVLWVSFIAIKHKQLSFDVAPMYKVHLSDTLLKSCYCMYKVCIYDILQ